MSRPIELRAATLADVAVVQEIEVRAGELFLEVDLPIIAGDSAPTAAAILAAAIAEGRLAVASLGGAVAGFVHLSVHPDAAHIDEIDVHPTEQRRGIGRALVEHAAAWAAAGGHGQLTLTTFRDVPWNGPFYRSAGFVELAEPLPPRLAAIRAGERARGLDVAPRVAMARRLP